jgi:hypothetical protein
MDGETIYGILKDTMGKVLLEGGSVRRGELRFRLPMVSAISLTLWKRARKFFIPEKLYFRWTCNPWPAKFAHGVL